MAARSSRPPISQKRRLRLKVSRNIGRPHVMKAVIASIVSVVLGLALGWCSEHHRAQREKAEIVQQMLEGIESSDGEHAIEAVRAVQFIESGETQRAVQLLSGPIATYYSEYQAGGTSDRRSKLRSLIEELAKTNEVVAARIAEASTNMRLRTR